MKLLSVLFLIFVFGCNCGKQEAKIKKQLPNETKVCEKVLSCNLILQEQLNNCIRCMFDMYIHFEKEIPVTKDILMNVLLESSCEDLDRLGTKYLIYQCLINPDEMSWQL